MSYRSVVTALLVSLVLPSLSEAAELVRTVRMKLSAGDLASSIAALEDQRASAGIDVELLTAMGWVARGALMLDRPEIARKYVGELRELIDAETAENLNALGAAIEVEGRLIAAERGAGEAIRFYERELDRAEAPALRSRIWKNVNQLSLEGSFAPAIGELASLDRGTARLLFFWAHWCGDCTAQAGSLARVAERYRGQGLEVIAVTRHYGTGEGGDPADPDTESAHIMKTWKEKYPGLEHVRVVVDTDAMIRYGASATPTFALVDIEGRIRTYAPTRLSETELAREIEGVLADRERVAGGGLTE